jgi:putative DNA primase/helicase
MTFYRVPRMSEQDIKDAVQGGITDAKAKAGDAGQSGKTQRGKINRNFPFKVDEGGIWKRVQRENNDGTTSNHWVRFGSELHILALTRNDESEGWGLLVEIVDLDGKRKLWPMPAHMLAGSGDAMIGELFGYGFRLEPNRDAKGWVRQYLMSAEPTQRARSVSGIGWHGQSYVLPDGAIGAQEDSEQILLQTSERPDHAFNVFGSLHDWIANIASPALGNSRLLLAISTAFAAPLLALSDDEGGGLHFKGASSSGKSTALTIAGSVWGGGGGTRGYVRNWRATGNALEGVSVMHNDCLLCLDEISQVDPRAAGEAAYMLANGKGKARAGREGQARKVLEWRLLFLSSGEIGLADKIKEGGGQIAAGMEVRVIDLRADAGAGMGLFEETHGAADPATFSQSLNRASSTFYGTAGRAFVTELVKDFTAYKDNLSALRRAFVQAVVPEGADGQVRRVADRFSLVAAAGEMATNMELTGWPAGAAIEAASRCFQDWLRDRGGIGSGEVASAKRRIAEALQVHGSSRFQRWKWNPGSDRIQVLKRLGFVKIEGDAEVEKLESTFYFLTEPFKELLAGLDPRTVVAELMAEGVIVSQDGKANKIHYVPSGVPQRNRLYQINAAKLDDTAGPDDAQRG